MLAILALVAGILSWICFGPVAGIAAIVLGILGLKKSGEMAGKGKGMSIAGLILGILGSIVYVLIAVLFVFAADQASDSLEDFAQDIGGEVSSSDYRLTTDLCEIDDFGFITFSGEIQNRTNSSKNFTIEAEFLSGGEVEVSSAVVTDIGPDESSFWEITGYTSSSSSVFCEVTGVYNFFN